MVACDLALVKSGTSAGDYVAASADGSDLSAGLLDLFDRKVFGQNPSYRDPQYFVGTPIGTRAGAAGCNPEAMYHALLGELDKSQADPNYLQAFDHLHRELAMGVSGLGASTGAMRWVWLICCERRADYRLRHKLRFSRCSAQR